MTSLEGSELSERELDILRLVATGASNKEIAQQLFISPNTVKVHLRNIFDKIGVLSRTEAAMYAVHNGLVKTSARPAAGLPVSIQEASISVENPNLNLPTRKKSLGRQLFWSLGLGSLLLLLILSLGGVALLNRPSQQPTQEPILAASPAESSTIPTPTLQPRWQVLPAMKAARSGLAAAAVDNRIYAIGGENDLRVTGMVEVYDPATRSWSEGKSMPLPVADIQAGVLGGKIYVPGGRLASGQISNALEIYDPLQDRWDSGPSLPYPVSAYALVAFEGRLFLFGGWDGTEILNDVLEYDPSLQTWSKCSPLPTPRAFSAAAEAGGKIYVIGGFDGKKALSVNEAYTPSLENSPASPWSSAPPLPEGRYGMGAAGVADTLLIIGGSRLTSGPAPSYHFFPSLGNWIETDQPEEQSWAGLAAVPLEQLVYVVGGTLGDQATNQVESYQAVYTVLIPIVR